MASAEERHIQLVRQTAVEVLECLGAPPGPDTYSNRVGMNPNIE